MLDAQTIAPDIDTLRYTGPSQKNKMIVLGALSDVMIWVNWFSIVELNEFLMSYA